MVMISRSQNECFPRRFGVRSSARLLFCSCLPRLIIPFLFLQGKERIAACGGSLKLGFFIRVKPKDAKPEMAPESLGKRYIALNLPELGSKSRKCVYIALY